MVSYWLKLVFKRMLIGMLFASLSVMIWVAAHSQATLGSAKAAQVLLLAGWIGCTVLVFDVAAILEWSDWQAYGLHYLIVVASVFVVNPMSFQHWLGQMLVVGALYLVNMLLFSYLLRTDVADVNAKITALKNRQ
ncbi:MAG TPA: hypothetical protein VGM95_00195 [Lactobacillaceae bacterium]|jgi:hypothetical protein